MKKMNLFKTIAVVVGMLLIVACLVFEFVPVTPVVATVVRCVSALYFLVGLVYFSLTEIKTNLDKDR